MVAQPSPSYPVTLFRSVKLTGRGDWRSAKAIRALAKRAVAAFMASDQAAAMTGTVANLTGGIIFD
jgi:hypothetical protein